MKRKKLISIHIEKNVVMMSRGEHCFIIDTRGGQMKAVEVTESRQVLDLDHQQHYIEYKGNKCSALWALKHLFE